MKPLRLFGFVALGLIVTSCSPKPELRENIIKENIVDYQTLKSLRPARGSVSRGYTADALNMTTRLSEVRNKCGTPVGEWEEDIPYFAKVKRVKY